MEKDIEDSGKTENNMVKVNTIHQKRKNGEKVCGMMEKEPIGFRSNIL